MGEVLYQGLAQSMQSMQTGDVTASFEGLRSVSCGLQENGLHEGFSVCLAVGMVITSDVAHSTVVTSGVAWQH
jgi:hypothetical protein